MDVKEIRRRDELPPLERAVSDTLDEWAIRLHGMTMSWADPVLFLEWLLENGYVVVHAKHIEQMREAWSNLHEVSAELTAENEQLRDAIMFALPLLDEVTKPENHNVPGTDQATFAQSYLKAALDAAKGESE